MKFHVNENGIWLNRWKKNITLNSHIHMNIFDKKLYGRGDEQ